MVSGLDKLDVYNMGKLIRNSTKYSKEGINVNFVEQAGDDEIAVRTYERGVEDETFSCGTGVTAAALTCYHNENGYNDVTVHTKGVETKRGIRPYQEMIPIQNIWLSGPAEKVFEGEIEID